MKTGLVLSCMILATVACVSRSAYEIDFSQIDGFEWDGRVCIFKSTTHQWGPLFTSTRVSSTDRVELTSRDGRVLIVDTEGYGDTPIASFALHGGRAIEILGTQAIWPAPSNILIVEPESAESIHESVRIALPANESSSTASRFRI